MTQPTLQKPLLLAEQAMEEGQVLSFCGGSVGVFSKTCPGKETPNEDAAGLVPLSESRGVLAVADGAGGMPGGRHASQEALQQLTAAVIAAGEEEGALRTAVIDGFEQANRAVMEKGAGSATTLVAVSLQGDRARPFHVGDSMIMIVGQRGLLKLQTVPHSPTGYAVEAGLLDERAAMVHEDRHLVSNLVGAADMRIEVGSGIELAEHDTLVLASDGLADNLEPVEIAEMVRKGPLQDAMARLARACLRRMSGEAATRPSKPDDLTFLLYRRNPVP